MNPTKRSRLTDRIIKQNPTFCCLRATLLVSKGIQKPSVKRWKSNNKTNRSNKKMVQCFLYLMKQNSNQQYIRHKNGHYILIKGTINAEDTKFVSIIYMRTSIPSHKILNRQKGGIVSDTVTERDFSISHISIGFPN